MSFQHDGLRTRECADCGHVHEEVIPYDETEGMISCSGALGSFELGLALIAISGIILARKKRS